MKKVIFFICFLFLFSCKSEKISLSDNLIGFWKLKKYTNPDSINLTSTMLVFISKDSIVVPLSDYMPIYSDRGNWKLSDSNPHIIEIFCEDTLFAGTWEIRNIKMNTVPQFSKYIKSFDMVKDSYVLTFER